MRDIDGEHDDRLSGWRRLRPDLDTDGVLLASDLVGAGARIAHRRKALFDRLDLGDRGFDVLLALWRPDETPMRTAGQVARDLSGGPISSGGVTFVVDRLARAGLVERRAHPADRRAVLVSLTPSGRAMTVAVMEALATAEGRVLASLEPAARLGLAAALRRIAEETGTGAQPAP